ncbi:MAG: magnesium and cobalt transport protein CorA, partial [Methylotenera sp. 24-45-7]
MKKAHPRRRKPNRTKKTGLPPGSLVYVGQGDDDISKLAEPKLTLISYDSEVFEETTITSDALASLHAD